MLFVGGTAFLGDNRNNLAIACGVQSKVHDKIIGSLYVNYSGLEIREYGLRDPSR
jgi:hypothetical protein